MKNPNMVTPVTNRSGPLSAEEKEYIAENVDTETVGAIAAAIKRNPKTVANFIKKQKLGKDFSATGKSDNSQSDILKKLKHKPFYRDLTLQFSEDELKYFEDYWVLTSIDFGGNVLSYEELELKEWLTFEILKSRILKAERFNGLKLESLKSQLEDEFKYDRDERDKDRIKYLQAEIASVEESIKYSKREFSDIAVKADKVRSGLVKSREQRTKDMDLADFNFKNYLKMAQQYDNKKRVGQEMAIIKKSENKKRKELYEFHEYADGEIDRPILNATSIEDGVN